MILPNPLRLVLVVCCLATANPRLLAADRTAISFERQQLTGTYFSEGANAGDLNGDQQADIVYGPYWFAGPDFVQKFPLYNPVPQNMEGYADNFFSWIHDFNGDGWNDVFVVGFPGTPAYVYENPKTGNASEPWKKHEVIDWVSNESPHFTNIVGDERPELVCTRDGFFGFASVNWEVPFGKWEFHPVSEKVTDERFGHGLGVGDVNGDGRLDLIHSKGWYEQPAKDAERSRWAPREASFTDAYGGAEMYAYDVDGDGDNDIITSIAAHDFGLAWYEQTVDGDQRAFKQHLIMGSHPSENRYGVLFSELHSVNLVDVDGDGLKDIVTGKTYYSHHKQSPMWDAGAVVYWFRLVRGKEGVDWIPYQADDTSGIGRQLSVADVNADGAPDFVVGGMLGAHVLTQQRRVVDERVWQEAQPKIYQGAAMPSVKDATAVRGPKAPLDPQSGRLAEGLEGEAAKHQVTAGAANGQGMQGFQADQWSGDSQLFWTGGKPGDALTIELPELPKQPGKAELQAVFTCARDYAIVQLAIDDQPLGPPIDFFHPEVITSGVLTFPNLEVAPGPHKLRIQILGANSKAAKSYMVGLDVLRWKPTSETDKPQDVGVAPRSTDGRTLNLDFETGTLDDWTAEGPAFAGQPVEGDLVSARRSDMQSGHDGKYWIGGFEIAADPPTGTLTSDPFPVTHPFGSYLANGGSTADTRVELVDATTGKVFHTSVGQENERMRQVNIDLRAFVGKEIFVRLVDAHGGGWGHLNFDQFRFHNDPPGKLTPAFVNLVADAYPHAGLNAQQAAAAMQVPAGFHVTVGASEPDVQQPIAMAIDDRGRVWIAEAYEYPQRAKGDKGRDRILIFEDTDGDGTLDQRKVFTEGLNLVSGIEVGFGGVWVGAAPYFMFIPDRDGNDVPDAEPEILLDGWGLQDTHETLNAFIWGPDGWLYGCHGVFTHSKVGKPGTPDDERIPLNAAVWRYHPVRHTFEVFSHGTSNPWGVDFNDHGQAFITACVIPHLYHVIQGARYERQGGQHFNPYTYDDIKTIADHRHYLGATPHGGNNKSDEAGGGHAHAGAMIYLGNTWPASYRNQIFMNNVHGQRLNMDILKPDRSGFVGSHGPDFLLTGDRASQILNLRYGPDGNAWMIDWYDMQACHRTEVELHDRTNGRIYKISYGQPEDTRRSGVTAANQAKRLAKSTDQELVELMLHPNDWFVRHARRLLQERTATKPLDQIARSRLVTIATTHDDDSRRLRAAWALHCCGELDEIVRTQLLADSSPYVRGWTIQLAMEDLTQRESPQWRNQLASLAAHDPSPVVRLYIASALQQLRLEHRWSILTPLCGHPTDADDPNLPLMYWYAAEPLSEIDADQALAFALAAGESIPLLREFMLRRIGSSGANNDALAVLVRGLGKGTDASQRKTFLQAMRAALRGQRQVSVPDGWIELSPKLLRDADREIQLHATALGVTFGDHEALRSMRTWVQQTDRPLPERRLALESLLDAKDPELPPLLLVLIDVPSPLREVAVRGLAQYDNAQTPLRLLARYSSLTAEERRAALATLCSRTNYGLALLEAIEKQHVPATDLTADLVRQLQNLRSAEVNDRLANVWGSVRETAADKAKLIAHYQTLITSSDADTHDPELGRAVFAKTCMKCHMLYGIGNKIGPDLTGSNRANLEYLLSNIVDPSAVMAKEYQATILALEDGRVVSGLIKAEERNSVTVQTSDALVVIPTDEIEERTLSESSMMPDDQLKQFTEQEIRGLIAYLQSTSQIPRLATADSTSQFFNGIDLTGWSGRTDLWSVENGELVGRTTGLSNNEWLVSDMSVSDFRLSVEVKLADNAGNSGIQFRSQVAGASVHGYQADIGAGWWGKLYEEHGRALLWDRSGEQYVKLNDWNRYEIEVTGSHIRTYINGELCVDLEDPAGAKRGIVAFQLHSGGPTEVRFRNLQLSVADPSTE